jgi:hypothetical protein
MIAASDLLGRMNPHGASRWIGISLVDVCTHLDASVRAGDATSA